MLHTLITKLWAILVQYKTKHQFHSFCNYQDLTLLVNFWVGIKPKYHLIYFANLEQDFLDTKLTETQMSYFESNQDAAMPNFGQGLLDKRLTQTRNSSSTGFELFKILSFV